MERCLECKELILDRHLSRVGDNCLHQECLRCVACREQLDSACYAMAGQFYCRQDYCKIFGPRCTVCKVVFADGDQVRKIEEAHYHLECFNCSKCGLRMVKGMKVALDHMGNLVCENDYLSKDEEKLVEESCEVKLEDTEEGKLPAEAVKQEVDKDSGVECDTSTDEDVKGKEEVDTKFPESPEKSDNEDSDKEGDDKKEGKDGKRRGPRTTIKAKQLELLKNVFSQTPKPTRLMREQLAKETGLPMRVIQVWFQNKRSKEKRMHQLRFMAQGVRPPFHMRGIHPMSFPPNAIAFDYRGSFPQECGVFGPEYGSFPFSPEQQQMSQGGEFTAEPHLLYPSPPPQPQDFPAGRDFSTETCFPSPPLSDYSSPPDYPRQQAAEPMAC